MAKKQKETGIFHCLYKKPGYTGMKIQLESWDEPDWVQIKTNKKGKDAYDYAKDELELKEGQKVLFEYLDTSPQITVMRVMLPNKKSYKKSSSKSYKKSEKSSSDSETSYDYKTPSTYGYPLLPEEKNRRARLTAMSCASEAVKVLKGFIEDVDSLNEVVNILYDNMYEKIKD